MNRRLCAALGTVLLAGVVSACGPDGTGRVVPWTASEGLRSSGVPAPLPTSTSKPPPAPQEPETHAGKGNATVTTKWPARPGFVTFACPKCTGNVFVETDGTERLLVNAIGAFKGTQWINIMSGDSTGKFTVEANAAWTLTIADERSLPVLEQGKPMSGKGPAVLSSPGKASSLAVVGKGKDNFGLWAVIDGFPDLLINEIGDYQGTVPLEGASLIEVDTPNSWTVTPA